MWGAELIAEFFNVGGADPLKLVIYIGVAVNATPSFVSIIVDRDVGQHGLFARWAAGGWKQGGLDFRGAHKQNANRWKSERL